MRRRRLAFGVAVGVLVASGEAARAKAGVDPVAELRGILLASQERVEAAAPARWPASVIDHDGQIAGLLVVTDLRVLFAARDPNTRVWVAWMVAPWARAVCAGVGRISGWRRGRFFGLQLDNGTLQSFSIASAAHVDDDAIDSISKAADAHLSGARGRPECTFLEPAPLIIHEASGIAIPEVFGTFERVDVRRSAGGVLWALFRPDGENSVDSIDVTIRRVPVSSDQLAIALRDTVEVMRFPGQARWKERPARLLEVTAWGGVQRAMSLDLLGRANVFPRHATVAAAARGEWVVVASGTGNVPARVRRAVLNAISALSVTAAPSPSPLSAVPPSP